MEINIKSSRTVIATDSAVSKIKELAEKEDATNSFLRVGVRPGGCNGFSYDMFFDSNVSDSDIVEEYGDIRIVVDSDSLEHVKGSTLDYKEGLNEKGFSIDNPNARTTCGCGESFS
jgi:iron-sulfur cluster assembly protein/iron-sulfur cluster insertion protein